MNTPQYKSSFTCLALGLLLATVAPVKAEGTIPAEVAAVAEAKAAYLAAKATYLAAKATETVLYKVVKYSAFSAIAAGIFRFAMRSGDTKPVRYDMEKIKRGLQEKDTRSVWEQVKYLFHDGFSGHVYESSSVKTGKDGKTLTVAEGCAPKGVIGWTWALSKPVAYVAAFPIAVAYYNELLRFGYKNWSRMSFKAFCPWIDTPGEQLMRHDTEIAGVTILKKVAEKFVG